MARKGTFFCQVEGEWRPSEEWKVDWDGTRWHYLDGDHELDPPHTKRGDVPYDLSGADDQADEMDLATEANVPPEADARWADEED